MRKTFIKTLCLVLALAGIYAAWRPAGASAVSTDCPWDAFCLWTSTNYTGSMKVVTGLSTDPSASNHCYNFVYPYDNSLDSALNNYAHRTYTIWESYTGTGSRALSINGYADPSGFDGTKNFHNFYPNFDNNIASSICRES